MWLSPGDWVTVLLWVLGGLFAIIGVLCGLWVRSMTARFESSNAALRESLEQLAATLNGDSGIVARMAALEPARASATVAHQRIDAINLQIQTFREQTLTQLAALGERLASDYVRRQDLSERLSDVLEPIRAEVHAMKRSVERTERNQLLLAQRLNVRVPSLAEDPT